MSKSNNQNVNPSDFSRNSKKSKSNRRRGGGGGGPGGSGSNNAEKNDKKSTQKESDERLNKSVSVFRLFGNIFNFLKQITNHGPRSVMKAIKAIKIKLLFWLKSWKNKQLEYNLFKLNHEKSSEKLDLEENEKKQIPASVSLNNFGNVGQNKSPKNSPQRSKQQQHQRSPRMSPSKSQPLIEIADIQIAQAEVNKMW